MEMKEHPRQYPSHNSGSLLVSHWTIYSVIKMFKKLIYCNGISYQEIAHSSREYHHVWIGKNMPNIH